MGTSKEKTDLLYYKNFFLILNRENQESMEEEQTNKKKLFEGLSEISDFLCYNVLFLM